MSIVSSALNHEAYFLFWIGIMVISFIGLVTIIALLISVNKSLEEIRDILESNDK